MVLQPTGDRVRPATADDCHRLLTAFLALHECGALAASRGDPAQALPIPLAEFTRHGHTHEMLLWLLYHDFVEHLRLPEQPDLTPALPANSLILSQDSAFTLTDRGVGFLSALVRNCVRHGHAAAFAPFGGLWLGVLPPTYGKIGTQRIFRWGQHLLKRFRQPPGPQELILASAEELQWSEWFDDPLPRRTGKNPKCRLHETIQDLNRRQVQPLIHFKGDGSGTRLGWEYV